MHHAFKTWCIVSTNSRFARSAPPVRSAGGAFLPFSRSSVYLSPTSIVPVRRDELRENVLRLLRARTIAVIGKIQILFINCSLYFADNVLYYPRAESEGSL